MVRASFIASAALIVLASCDDTGPAGGQGYFDPPAPAPIFDETPITRLPPQPQTAVILPDIQAQPPVSDPALAQTQIAQAPAVPPAQDPGATALAQDVTAVLEATAPQPVDPNADIGIDPNDQSINLAEQSQEQQKRQREIAAAQRQAARDQLVVIEPEPVPQVDPNANVVAFARGTSHPVGTKRYNRPAFRDRIQSRNTCRRFASADEAQREFLAAGGPRTDRFNLDPDGDGFACTFDPEPYRALKF